METTKNQDIAKYESGNPIIKLLLGNFMKNISLLLHDINAKDIFEAGCGNGYVTESIKHIYPNAKICAIDVDKEKIQIAKTRVKDVHFSVGTIYDTKQKDNCYDLVVSTEVLEHLDDPLLAMNELIKISKKYILISTPNEPLWRIANMARFKYIGTCGNTPGHINHWSKNALCGFVRNVCDIQEVKTPFPWTMILCKKRK